ncbi:uncharacterized protein KGF55_000408 [Candida pseudojiufengensis]|uniref:uncharacterized protein n=1 Tax=Candida pseudojiufengensis TaxID=497109 RepID=UPI002224C774|nr:uncharacterized protein KGF55_000408 [Candida pseudojiufengensis]KAI5966999.1 hypothetical protein KGF55_000408 [Candida pseudojiufengensis]
MFGDLNEKETLNKNWLNNDLPIHNNQRSLKKYNRWLIPFWLLFIFIISSIFGKTVYNNNLLNLKVPDESLCPILEKINPNSYITNPDNIKYILEDDKFHELLNKRFQNSIKIPTEIYDDMQDPVGNGSKDKRWYPFLWFHHYLEKTYPLIYKNLKVEKINKLGLVYTWKGTDDKKKPIMLTAHQDVVPVQEATLNKWDSPPFDGHIDNKTGFIIGRGVCDCKNLLIGLLSTIEFLLEENKFKPKRTIILAFGYDEESAGEGAKHISNHLISQYGENNFLQIIDEGTAGYENLNDRNFVFIASGEKGHLNSQIEIFSIGGHSSVPDSHTSIGIIAKLINEIESNPFKPILTKSNPVMSQLYCLAEHTNISKNLKSNILKSQIDPQANARVIEYLNSKIETKYLIQTSQAVDIIEGGVKANALPEHVSMLVNTRIAIESSVEETVLHYKNLIEIIAKKYNFGFILNNETIIEPTEKGHFKYTTIEPLEPAPVSPQNESWKIFGGSLRYFYENILNTSTTTTTNTTQDPFIITPFISTGNTDTKNYWKLTKNIYRYIPGNISSKSGGVHSVNEKINISSHYDIIAFYYYFLQVIDKVEDESFD